LAAPSAWSSNGTRGKYFCINISCGCNVEGVAQNLEIELEQWQGSLCVTHFSCSALGCLNAYLSKVCLGLCASSMLIFQSLFRSLCWGGTVGKHPHLPETLH
jgi:hypothetical protein